MGGTWSTLVGQRTARHVPRSSRPRNVTRDTPLDITGTRPDQVVMRYQVVESVTM